MSCSVFSVVSSALGFFVTKLSSSPTWLGNLLFRLDPVDSIDAEDEGSETCVVSVDTTVVSVDT